MDFVKVLQLETTAGSAIIKFPKSIAIGITV
jgi:hypothetical protein